ncbi:MAG: EVE domain-containing protein [Dehalococcoidales bacterium]|nr:EVE domain-containing protein [Dehalococcoidales bacterium]
MNYYVTKSNPYRYRLKDALEEYSRSAEVDWTTCKNAKPGGILLIAASGKDAGIYAKATIVTEPIKDIPDDKYWVNPEDGAKKTWMVEITSLQNLTKHPITERELRACPELVRLAEWLHIQGTNRYLDDSEADAMNDLLKRYRDKT